MQSLYYTYPNYMVIPLIIDSIFKMTQLLVNYKSRLKYQVGVVIGD